MPMNLCVRLRAFFKPERHQIWQWIVGGCALFWILVVIAFMGIR